MSAALAAAMFPSMSAPSSVARRRLMIDAYPIFLISEIAPGVMAPAHATVVSTLAKFRMPGTSCLITCALDATDIRQPAMFIAANLEVLRRMPHLLETRSLPPHVCLTYGAARTHRESVRRVYSRQLSGAFMIQRAGRNRVCLPARRARHERHDPPQNPAPEGLPTTDRRD